MCPGNPELVAANRAQLVTYPPTVPNCKLYIHDHRWVRPTHTECVAISISLRVARASAMCSRRDSIRSLRINFYYSVVASLVGCAFSSGSGSGTTLHAEPDISRLTCTKEMFCGSENHPNPLNSGLLLGSRLIKLDSERTKVRRWRIRMPIFSECRTDSGDSGTFPPISDEALAM